MGAGEPGIAWGSAGDGGAGSRGALPTTFDFAARVLDDTPMKHSLSIIACLFSLSFSSCDEDEADPSADGSNSGDGDGDVDPSDGDSESGDGDGDSESSDAFCSHAKKGFAALDDYIAVMNELSLTGEEVPASRINENGALAIEFATDFGDEMADAAAFVVDDDVTAAFDDLLIYQADYMLPQAELAATATSDMEYGMASLEFLKEDGVAEAAANGAVASGTARLYALERCGTLD